MSNIALPAIRKTDWDKSHYWRRKHALELPPDDTFENSVREFVRLASNPSLGSDMICKGLQEIGLPATANIDALFPTDGSPDEDGILKVLLQSKAKAEWNKELIFEEIRAAEFPHLPSRRRAIFLFGIDQDPQNFIRGMKFSSSDRYVVEIEDLSESKVHKADFRLLDCNVKPLAEMKQCAREYWSGTFDAGDHMEVLLEGPFRIVRIVQLPH